jgi:hypothetical protein
LDRKEYFRQLELQKKQKAEELESERYPFRPQLSKRGVCDCCGKMKCNYKVQLFLDGIIDNDFGHREEINGFDESVTRLRKGLLNRYSKEALYRR